MRDITTKILNPSAIADSKQMMVAMARLTQRGHKISNINDFTELFNREYSPELVNSLAALPHPTIQKFGVINMLVLGASRRFLAQITRHQNEVKFMSGSLQYSDYSAAAKWVVPYEIMELDDLRMGNARRMPKYHEIQFLNTCNTTFRDYEEAIRQGIPHDAAAYMMPQALSNILVISATPYQWKHMITQRICHRNSLETSYVMLRCLEQLQMFEPGWFGHFQVNYPCLLDGGVCREGSMKCKKDISPTLYSAKVILKDRFPLLMKGAQT